MKLKNSYFYTLRENVKDEDSVSGNLLARSGMIKKNSAGVYMYLPMGHKVIQNIEQIVREEMNATGAQEVLMPSLIPEEIYISSGRRANFGKSMFTLKDRFNKPYVLGPTHEELFAMAAGMHIHSYKDLPFNLYQFQTKFRDEARPRFGLIRVREFIMKDAYSFDTDLAGLDVSYKKMFDAYKNAFDRMHLDYKIVKADTGVMGGLLSEEFQAVTDIGEDVLVLCDSCSLSTNLEIAQCNDSQYADDPAQPLEKQLVYTPHAKTIEEVSAFLEKDPASFVKTLIYQVDDQVVACMVRGNRDVNEVKLQKAFGANEVGLADFETVQKVTHAQVGFAGPIGLDIPVIMDYEISHMKNFIVGANQTNYHYTNVNVTDFTPSKIMDLRQVQENDTCPCCGGKIVFKKGIEIGNTFKLGDKYSKAMNLYYSDSNNQLQPVIMGSYGLGLCRTMAALVEQNHDDNGIIWPVSVAPYKVAVVCINIKNEEQVALSNQIYESFTKAGIDVILDDRDERAGVKFKDMDLIGIPYRVTVGKLAGEGKVEFKPRTASEAVTVTVDEAVNMVLEAVKNA
ncbi:MAG: proline--tRNA ligase [Erysipelotrichaceae bacterium]|nr:proline--tRNA ligase [Erysipelotrichaceae bacterium]